MGQQANQEANRVDRYVGRLAPEQLAACGGLYGHEGGDQADEDRGSFKMDRDSNGELGGLFPFQTRIFAAYVKDVDDK